MVETDEGEKVIGVERIHIEQDAGKLMHDQHPTMSYVDLNRCGVALMEIVSKPDMRSPAEAGAYVKKLRAILQKHLPANSILSESPHIMKLALNRSI